ncbi:MAG: S8 family serine peptidase, partial [Oligoflexia bacterium]|nr:S8 family serine peptidase [Oligoflexia bacterium]
NNKLIPVNFFSFYDFFKNLYFETPSPSYMRYPIKTLSKLFDSRVRIINFSGSLDHSSDDFYRLFENYPDVIWIVAAGNQKVDIDDKENQNKYPLIPQVYVNKEGKRFDNIINVTVSNYNPQENKSYIRENYGPKFVDISVDSLIRGTSFAAPMVTACIVAILKKSPKYLSAKEIKELLIKYSIRKAIEAYEETPEGIPVLDCQNILNNI